MKRYRVVRLDFDTRATLLKTEIQSSWEPGIRAQWLDNHRRVREDIIHEFGVAKYEQKIIDFVDMGPAPMSVLAFHNRFYGEIRRAFAGGNYYPALLAAGALGKRILNHLLIALREDFQDTPQYSSVAKKESFDNWDWVIKTLAEWGVLLPEAANAFRELKHQRNAAVHFRPDLDEDPRPPALEAVRLLSKIIEVQFAAFGEQPWFIEDTPGASFIRQEYESNPFVAHVLLPNAFLVGPRHQMHATINGWRIEDDAYPDVEITDEDFAAMFRGDTQDGTE